MNALIGWPEAVRLALLPQVRSQLEVLLAEKAALAAENERLAHQNCGLQELLQYSMQARPSPPPPPTSCLPPLALRKSG